MGIKITDGIDANGVMLYDIMLDRDYYHLHPELLEWCREQYGFNTGRWTWSSVFGHIFFTFYDEKDRNWFMLKWVK
jgi:hypothetical protein